ncbi:arylamine N-acetyltransferase [Oricola sp.]|uniref:arylamine N-acetyltransferase family protein n=1 Tax=Oricola sp. TaxID=1979950 RepID=UPI0025E9CD46|nr:arylamine N-acetyltransferase [Oricola sp.]MCI5076731.1 arylamine N-acetyltransferase [Oricola sp.]
MDIERYLHRIGLKSVPATAEGLRALQTAQMQAITFEDIDPLLGVVPDVTLEGIYEKTVVQGRGGYCFELNSLFGAALAALGFQARRVMARVRNGAPQGAQRSHLAWLVDVEGEEWLADTGFGGSGASVPLRTAERDTQAAPSGDYRLREDEAAGELVLERGTPEGWLSLYGFDRVPVLDADIAAANFVCARWERAPFSGNLMLSRHRADGRVSLLNTALRVENREGVTRSVVASPGALHEAMTELFALPLDRATTDAIWARLEALGHLADADGGTAGG